MRKHSLATGEIYHLMNKSIAGYEIFNKASEYEYMINAMQYFSLSKPPNKFSYFLKHDPVVRRNGFKFAINDLIEKDGRCVQIIAYCLMPTHFHILAKQINEEGITTFMRNTLNTYTRFFNIRQKRKGPLWVNAFKNVPIQSDEQLLHVTRYLHLNPTSAGLVSKPENWVYSSYKEYVSPQLIKFPITDFKDLFKMTPREHKEFTENQQGYQRELAFIKNIIME